MAPSRRRFIVAGTVACVAGCQSETEPKTTDDEPGSGQSDTSDEIAIYWEDSEAWRAALEEELVPAFESESGTAVDTHYKVAHRPEWHDAIRQRLDTGDPFDLYFVQSGELPSLVEFLDGPIRPVGDVVADLRQANGEPVAQGNVVFGGEPYVVPQEVILGGVLNYRSDVYEEVGLEVPRTWEDLLANVRAIDESDAFDGHGFGVSAPQDAAADDAFTNWFYNAGGGYFRWADGEQTDLEVAFEPEHARRALEFMRQLRSFSPAHAGGRLELAGDWISGDLAHCLFPSAHLAALARQEGNDHVARHTRQTLVPKRDETVEPIDRGWARVQGPALFDGGNVESATAFVRHLYEGPNRQARRSLLDRPLLGLPPYPAVLETETYQQAPILRQNDGHFLELVRHAVEEIAPSLAGDRPRTPAGLYARRDTTIADLVHAVVVEDAPIDDEIETARGRLRSRLEDGRSRLT